MYFICIDYTETYLLSVKILSVHFVIPFLGQTVYLCCIFCSRTWRLEVIYSNIYAALAVAVLLSVKFCSLPGQNGRPYSPPAQYTVSGFTVWYLRQMNTHTHKYNNSCYPYTSRVITATLEGQGGNSEYITIYSPNGCKFILLF